MRRLSSRPGTRPGPDRSTRGYGSETGRRARRPAAYPDVRRDRPRPRSSSAIPRPSRVLRYQGPRHRFRLRYQKYSTDWTSTVRAIKAFLAIMAIFIIGGFGFLGYE